MRSGIFEVYIETFFSSAHRLENYKGKCENLHGHNWKIGVLVKSKKLDTEEMVIDFKILKEITKKCVSEMDHKFLNDIKYFKTHQPTAENIARYLHKKILNMIKSYKTTSLKIIVWETEFQFASYEK
jgi:6-pyruvoyltetrahydropterin/6-carboxytetrahydropterin synthase